MQSIFHTVGVVGTGAMGRGIAQMAAQAGSRVRLFDLQPDAADAARAVLADTWGKLVAKGRLEAAQQERAVGEAPVFVWPAEAAEGASPSGEDA